MGRPLAKRFFGNRNVGSASTLADNGIGGEGLYTIANPGQLGSFIVNSTATTVPALVIPTPEIPGGVRAEAQVVWEVESVTVTNGLAGHNYNTGTTATLTGLGGGVIISLATVGSGQGEVQTVSFGAGSDRGEFTTLPTVATTYQIVGSGAGNGDGLQQALVKFRVKQINVTEKGSGYITAPTITWNNTGVIGTGPGSTTSVLTTDSGALNNQGNAVTNQENAIIIHANVGGEGGTLIGDIKKQQSTHRYKVRTADGVAVCKLVANSSPAAGQAYIMATDDNGNTYFVTKLTAHRAVLTRWTNNEAEWLFDDGERAKWTLGNAQAGQYKSVQIENA